MSIQPVPAASIAAICVTLLLSIGIPIALFIIFRVRFKARIAPFFLGCVSFVLFALVLEQLLHSVVLGGAMGAKLQSNIWFYALYGGCAAGLFEETGRYLFMLLVIRRDKQPQNALMYGAGHGGIEAIIIVGLTYINNLVYALMINAGQAEALLSPLSGTARTTMEQTLAAFSTVSPTLFLMAGLERVMAISLHIALSVLIYTAIKRRKFGYAVLAFALHMLVDAVTLVVSQYVSAAIIELVVLIMVLPICLYAYKLYKAARAELESAKADEVPPVAADAAE